MTLSITIKTVPLHDDTQHNDKKVDTLYNNKNVTPIKTIKDMTLSMTTFISQCLLPSVAVFCYPQCRCAACCCAECCGTMLCWWCNFLPFQAFIGAKISHFKNGSHFFSTTINLFSYNLKRTTARQTTSRRTTSRRTTNDVWTKSPTRRRYFVILNGYLHQP